MAISLTRRLALVTLGLVGLCGISQAQTKPIRLIVPYAAGGPIDVTARVLAERVKDSLGPIIVENRPGAGGNIGADVVAKATPDGSVIGIAATATHAVNPWLYRRMPYNAATDFTPITQIVRVPNVLVLNADTAKRLRIASLADFLRYARANPGRLNYGSGGNGSAGHLAGELFKARAGVYAVHIPYNGGSPAQLALLSGQVDFNFDNLATAAPNIQSGKLLALAVTTPTRSAALPAVPALAELAQALAQLDGWSTLAERALSLGWQAPEYVAHPCIQIEGGRHPVVESRLAESGISFMANDTDLGHQSRLQIITGPNMGGKSTYMRQVALIVLLACMGSPVPAKRCVIGPIDAIYTRIGAADDLANAQSTFMLEMTEAAQILHAATPNSLVLMDEIGRGTSTYDGLSLAGAIASHLHDKCKSFVLFATHYFELTDFPLQHPAAFNVHVSAAEQGKEVIFLHHIEAGPANRSHGIQVARLAGMPQAVLNQAQHALAQLEAAAQAGQSQVDLFATPPEASAPAPSAAELRLADLDPDAMSPREALEALYALKRLL